MKRILNLVDPLQGSINYKILKFPDGQQDIQILNDFTLKPVEIKSRFNSFQDLELIICTVKALRNLGVKEIHLFIPYLLGARSDRQFIEGGTSYLRDVIAPILNSLELESITCVDVHSDVAAACIKNLKVIENNGIVANFIISLANNRNILPTSFLENCVFISPDSGSLKKIYKTAAAINFKGEILTCSKYRDPDGKLSKTQVPILPEHEDKHLIIIDDICDGGRTFLNIAEAIKNQQPNRTGKIYLIVSHGIFSAGLDNLKNYLDKIGCSNSFSNINDSFVEQYDIFI